MTPDPRKSSIEQQINQNLRLVYEQAQKEDVPDRFKDLLKKLKDQDKQK